MTYKIYWTNVASSDLSTIINYIAEDNIKNAAYILKTIKSKIDKLVKFPERGRFVIELKELGITSYREIIYSPWRVIYKIEESTVLIMGIIDSRRNINDILLDRFLNDQ